MRPFEYQGDALEALDSARKRGQKRALLVMATGLGKTVVSGFDLMRQLEQDPGRVLFLSHDTNINAQARKTFVKMLGKKYSHGNFNGREKHLHHVDFLYATLQTMANHRGSFDPREFKYIVLDEAHHGEAATFKPTLEYFQPDFFLAVTATPERGDSKDITDFFGEPVYRLGVFEALAKRYLCHVDYRLMTDEIQNLEVLDTPAGKLSIRELNRTVFIPKRDEEIARVIAEKTKNIESPRVMIFCASIEHAERMAALLPHAALLHSQLKDKKEVQRRLEAFRTGEITTVLTVDMLNEGIDVPEANVLVFLRSTSSRTIFLQQLGRGLRKMLGKTSVLVLDFVANCERIEMIDWLTEGVKQELARATRDRVDTGDIGGDGGSIEDTIDLHLDGSEFDEQLLKLIDYVRDTRLKTSRFRGELDQAIALGYIREQAKRIGKTPTPIEFDAARIEFGYPGSGWYKERFGSWNSVVRRAGLRPNQTMERKPKEVLIAELQAEGTRIKRTPQLEDIKVAAHEGRCSGQHAYIKAFGTWNSALKAAGFELNRKRGLSDDELLDQLREGARRLARTPGESDLKTLGLPSAQSYSRRWGSLNKAIEAAGLKPRRRMSSYTREEKVNKLRQLAQELGRTPKVDDVHLACKDGRAPSASSLTKEFGSFKSALKAAGLTK